MNPRNEAHTIKPTLYAIASLALMPPSTSFADPFIRESYRKSWEAV